MDRNKMAKIIEEAYALAVKGISKYEVAWSIPAIGHLRILGSTLPFGQLLSRIQNGESYSLGLLDNDDWILLIEECHFMSNEMHSIAKRIRLSGDTTALAHFRQANILFDRLYTELRNMFPF